MSSRRYMYIKLSKLNRHCLAGVARGSSGRRMLARPACLEHHDCERGSIVDSLYGQNIIDMAARREPLLRWRKAQACVARHLSISPMLMALARRHRYMK